MKKIIFSCFIALISNETTLNAQVTNGSNLSTINPEFLGWNNAGVSKILEIHNNFTNQPITFFTSTGTPSEKMRLNANGYLGLGITTAPSSLLHLNSTTTGNLFRTDGSSSLVNQWQLFTNNEKFRLSIPANSDNVVQNAVNADGSFALQTTFC